MRSLGMTDFVGLLGLGITSFIASNIDDTFILILLFATPGLLARHIIMGQFVGIVLLVLISSLAVLLVMAIPSFILGFMGLVPIVIGIKSLLESRESEEGDHVVSRKYLSILSVTAITISNGGDDIGVFTPLFAKYSTLTESGFLIILFLVMTGIWCIVTYYFFRHPSIASRVNALSKTITPVVLIFIGTYVILDSIYFR
jgi:cadmium resistance protein CadD (predicted permease)